MGIINLDQPSRYQDVATGLLHDFDACGVAVIVFEGARGNGFALASTDPTLNDKLPRVLRQIADSIQAANVARRN